MDFYQLLATIAGLLVVVAGLPQAYKMYRAKEAKDVSPMMFGLFFVAQAIWLIYGLHLGDLPIIISNIGALLATMINLGLIWRYSNNG